LFLLLLFLSPEFSMLKRCRLTHWGCFCFFLFK